MYLRNLAILVGLLVVIGLIGWAFTRVYAQPVDEVTAKWSSSGHADRTSEAFRDWDNDAPPVIPPSCAKCHSTIGYLDFLGEDGTTPGKVDNPSPIGTTIECTACHNESAAHMTSVDFPSQAEITDLKGQGNCMQCHQGLASTAQVDSATQGIDADTVAEGVQFVSVHYGPAAATRWGGEVRGGYEYPGKEYVGFFGHTHTYQQCTQCHDAHSLRVNPRACSPCHPQVVEFSDLRKIRIHTEDWSGTGNTKQGVAVDIDELSTRLYAAIQDYAATVVQKPIVYSSTTFPYFFVDTNANGTGDPDELAFPNRYLSWTPRLLRAAYNLHYGHMDQAAYTHNPQYMIQLLQDSLADLGQQVQVDMTGMTRP